MEIPEDLTTLLYALKQEGDARLFKVEQSQREKFCIGIMFNNTSFVVYETHKGEWWWEEHNVFQSGRRQSIVDVSPRS